MRPSRDSIWSGDKTHKAHCSYADDCKRLQADVTDILEVYSDDRAMFLTIRAEKAYYIYSVSSSPGSDVSTQTRTHSLCARDFTWHLACKKACHVTARRWRDGVLYSYTEWDGEQRRRVLWECQYVLHYDCKPEPFTACNWASCIVMRETGRKRENYFAVENKN